MTFVYSVLYECSYLLTYLLLLMGVCEWMGKDVFCQESVVTEENAPASLQSGVVSQSALLLYLRFITNSCWLTQ